MIGKITLSLKSYIYNSQSRSIGFVFIVNSMIFSTWAVRIPDLKAYLDISDGQLGLALLASPLGVVLFAPVTTLCINKLGAGRTTIMAAFAMSSSIVVLGLPQSYMQLWSALFYFGVCNGLLDISMNAVASAIEKKQSRIIMSTTHGFWSLGAMCFSLLAGIVADQGIDYLHHFCAISLLAIVSILVLRKNIQPIVDHQESNFKWVWPGKHLALLIAVAFIVFLCEGVVLDWNSVFYKDILNAPVAQIGFGFAAFSAAMAVARFSGDALIEKYSLKKILITASIICIAGLWLYALGISIWICTLSMLVCGLGFSVLIPILFREAGRSEFVAPSLGLALVSTLGYMGFLAGPALIGFVSEGFGLQMGFAVGGALMLIALGLSLKVK